MSDFEELKESIMNGEEEKTAKVVDELLEEGIKPQRIIDDGIVIAMKVVGEKFDSGEYFIPDMLVSADASQAALDKIEPLLETEDTESSKKAVFATVKGDQHDIGKNLVSMMLEGAGFELVDMGVDVPISKIAPEVKKTNADLVAISALLTTTMLAMEPAIKKIKEVDENIPVVVGGAPLTQDFADKIGADGFAPDALRAIDLAKRLLKVE